MKAVPVFEQPHEAKKGGQRNSPEKSVHYMRCFTKANNVSSARKACKPGVTIKGGNGRKRLAIADPAGYG